MCLPKGEPGEAAGAVQLFAADKRWPDAVPYLWAPPAESSQLRTISMAYGRTGKGGVSCNSLKGFFM